MEDFCFNNVIRFIGSRGGECAQVSGVIIGERQTDLFAQFASQRRHRTFAVFDLAACLHEPRSTGFAHQQKTSGVIIYKCCCNTDREFGTFLHTAFGSLDNGDFNVSFQQG